MIELNNEQRKIVEAKENKVLVDEDILENSKAGIETIVKYGEKIGTTIL